jgi:hypothetical protein
MGVFDRHPNAQKWSAELVMEHLEAIEKDATEGDSLFLAKGLTKRGLYRHVWAYWKKAFYENEDIIEKMLQIESVFEAKLLEGALKKQLSGRMVTMALKNNYNWHDAPRRSDSLLSSGGQ